MNFSGRICASSAPCSGNSERTLCSLLGTLAYNVGPYRLLGSKKIPKSTLVKKLEAGDRNIYKEYISFRCYKGKVVPSIERRRKVEFELLYIP